MSIPATCGVSRTDMAQVTRGAVAFAHRGTRYAVASKREGGRTGHLGVAPAGRYRSPAAVVYGPADPHHTRRYRATQHTKAHPVYSTWRSPPWSGDPRNTLRHTNFHPNGGCTLGVRTWYPRVQAGDTGQERKP